MPQENVDFVLASYEWGNSQQPTRLAREWWHADGEYINSREDPDHGVYRGLEAIEKLFASWIEVYPDLKVWPVEARANGERVFVWVRLSGHSAHSGAPLDMEGAHVVTLENGKIRRLEEFLDRAEALEAAGLSEQDAHADS